MDTPGRRGPPPQFLVTLRTMALPSKRRILFSLLPLIVLVALWEGGARLVGRGQCTNPAPATSDWREMRPDKMTIWSLVPDRELDMGRGRARVGPDGIRERDRPRPRTARDRRIVTLGDSSVFGWEVPDGQTWQENLENLLNQAFPQVHFEVVNLGVPGFSSVQSLKLLERVGWAWEPDLVLGGNLFSDCNIDVFQDEKAIALLNPERSLVHRLLRGSRLYCSLWSAHASWYAHRGQSRNRVLMPGVQGSTWMQERLDTFVEMSRVPLGRYRDNLETLRVECQRRDVKLAFLMLAQEWDAGVWTAPHRPPPSEGEVLPWTPYREAMRGFADSHGLPLLSMPDIFAAAARRQDPRTLFVDPVHPSAEGARIMAQALFDFLARRPELLRLPASSGTPVPGGSP